MIAKLTQNLIKTQKLSLKTSPMYKFCAAATSNSIFISAEKAQELSANKNVKFIDCRDIEEYKISHITAKAYSGDMFFWYRSLSDIEEVNKFQNEFQEYVRKMGVNNDDHLVTYEDALDTRKGASCRAYYILKLLGHQNVSVLNGGLQAWTKNGYALTSEVEPIEKDGNFEAKFDASLWADKQQVLENVQNPGQNGHVFLDVRDDEEWTGESSSPLGKDFVPKKGRIEGAKWIPWYNFMTKKGDITYINEPQVVEQQLQEIGITSKDTPITIYCFKGARASNTYMALQNAGYANIKNYFASWNEWARDESLPYDSKVLTL